MRNLKRALSMALAAIMVLGLMVVGASAAGYEDFTDKDEIQYTEAVNTMVSLGVISGKEDGSYYDPTGSLTRAEACTLIARMLGGGKDPVLGSNIKSNFTDTKGHWAETYIAYCANLGIIVGVGDGSFNPDGVLTGTAAAKMVLCALGYKPEFEGIGGANWELATNTLATKVKLYDGLNDLNPSDTITRDQVAQLIYNGVQANEVEYRNLEGDYQGTLYAVEGDTMLTNRFRVVKVTGILEANDKVSVANGYKNSKGEVIGYATGDTALKGKSLLRVTNVAGKETIDYSPLYNAQTFTVATPDEMVGQEIVLYVQFQNELAPNAASSTVIGDPIITNNNTVVETSTRLKDTTAVRSALREGGMSNVGTPVEALYTENKVVIGGSTLGVTDTITKNLRGTYTDRSAGIFQRFIDNDGNGTPDYLVQIVPVLTSVNSISTNKEDYTFTGITGTISAADIVTDLELARNDVVLVTRYADDCYYFTAPETVEGTVASWNTNNNTVSVDGTSYGNSGGKNLGVSGVDQILNEETVDNTYLFYLDPAGNVLGYKETNAIIGNYAIVQGYSRTGNANMGYSAQVKLLMQDGTTGTYNLNLAASAVNLGLAKANDSTKTKENAITVNSWVGDSNDTTHGTNLVGHLFSYTLDNNTVTIGKANNVNDNYFVGQMTSGSTVNKNTADYTMTSVNGGTGTLTMAANDQTVFFIKDKAGNYFVVVGLSKLPAEKVTLKTTGEAVAYKAAGTSTYIAKAMFLESTDVYKAARDYVFVTDKYVRTNVEGTPIYSFTVVNPDGTTSTMETKSNVNTIKNKVCEYDYDGKYVNFYPTEAVLYNQYYVKSMQNNTVTLGNKDTGATVISLRVNSNAAIWDVQSDPAADTLSENDVVSLIVDTEGAVKAAFIYDVLNGKFVPNPLDPTSGASISVGGTGLTADGQNFPATLTAGTEIPVVITLPSTMNAPVLTINDSTSVTMAPQSKAALVAANTTATVTYEYKYVVTADDVTRGSVSFAVSLSQAGLDSLKLTWTVGNGSVTPPEEGEYTVTVTVDGVTDTTLTKNIKEGEAYSATYTAPEGKIIASVSANGTIAADQKSATLSIASVTKAETIAITLADEGTVVPPSDLDYAPGTAELQSDGTTINVYYYGDTAPSSADQATAINNAKILTKTVSTVVGGKPYESVDGKLVEIKTSADGNYTITAVPVVKIAIDTTSNVVAYAKSGSATKVEIANTGYQYGDVLLTGVYGKTKDTDYYEVSRTGGLSIAGLTISKDMLLQKGYQLSFDTSLTATDAKYSEKEITTSNPGSALTGSGEYIADGVWLQVKGKANDANAKLSLVVNGNVKATGTVDSTGGSGHEVTYKAFQFNAATDADSKGIVKLEEKGGYELYIDGVKVDGAYSNKAGQVLPAAYADKTFVVNLDAETLAYDKTTQDSAMKTAASTVEDGATKVTLDLSTATPDKDGKISIVTKEKFLNDYTTVTFAKDAEVASFVVVSGSVQDSTSGNSVTTSGAAVSYYVKKGATLYVTTSDITSTDGLSNTDDYMAVTIDGATEATKITSEWVEDTTYSAEFVWTVSGKEAGIAFELPNKD